MLEKSFPRQALSPLNREKVAEFVKLADNFACSIFFKMPNGVVNAKSMLGLMTIGRLQFESLSLVCDGEDEEEAMNALSLRLKLE